MISKWGCSELKFQLYEVFILLILRIAVARLWTSNFEGYRPFQSWQENPRIFPMMIWDTKPDLNEKYIVIEYVLILILWYGSIVEGYRHGFCAIKYIYMWNLNYWHVSLLYIGSTFYSRVHECFLSKSDQNWVFLRVTARLQVCPKQDTPFYGSHMKESQESEAL